MNATVSAQRDQPPGVPPLQLTGERTLPDVPEENYWFQRHLAVYEWIAPRGAGRPPRDHASGGGPARARQGRRRGLRLGAAGRERRERGGRRRQPRGARARAAALPRGQSA